jgi:hypothetical protein
MSAGSRKKHSSAHKGYQAGSDQLEVSALIAGAGNGRDVEEKLGGAVRISEKSDIAPEDIVPNGAQEFTGVGNEGPTTAGNADTAPPVVEQRPGRLARAILSPEAFDEALKAPKVELDLAAGGPIGYVPPHALLVPNALHKGRNIITIVTRSVKAELFSADFSDIIKHMFELAPHVINGLTTGFYEVLDGHLEDNSSTPVIEVTEREGRVFDRALTEWAMRINDWRRNQKKQVPASQRATLIQEEDVTIDLFFIEPDSTGKKVLAAWHGKNVRPISYPGISSMRNIHGSISEHTLQIGLGGQFRRGEAALEAAQLEFDKLAASIAKIADAINAQANG